MNLILLICSLTAISMVESSIHVVLCAHLSNWKMPSWVVLFLFIYFLFEIIVPALLGDSFFYFCISLWIFSEISCISFSVLRLSWVLVISLVLSTLNSLSFWLCSDSMCWLYSLCKFWSFILNDCLILSCYCSTTSSTYLMNLKKRTTLLNETGFQLK